MNLTGSDLDYDKICIHYGEIGLKGKNQPDFRQQLEDNIRFRLRSLGIKWPVRYAHSYFYLDLPADATENERHTALSALKDVPGIAWYGPAMSLDVSDAFTDGTVNYDLLEPQITALAREKYIEEGTFAVRVNRADKRLPGKSIEYERRFGAVVIEQTPWEHVDLSNPDITLHIDMYAEYVFIYAEKIPGAGGLPVSITGKVLTLLSGGIDSPAAAYLAAKRGCSVDFIHFTANKFQMENAPQYKVSRLVQDLSKVTLRSTLYLVPYTHFEFEILGNPIEYELILFRRFMSRAAEVLAGRIKAQALVTGDNLAQVASQTLENLVSATRSISIPVLRPLITYDKKDIVDLAKSIGTYKLSLEPYKDCCSIISKHPRTVSTHAELQEIEDDLFDDYKAMIDATLNDAVVLKYKCGKQVD